MKMENLYVLLELILILQKVKADAEEKLGEEVKNVVITCPAYFGTAERTATKNAGEIAGLNVIEIIF